MAQMMQCGHAANAKDSNGNLVCVICYGIVPGADKVAEAPDLTGRMARCVYNPSTSTRASSTNLPFFSHHPDREYDDYYCGCRGWD